MKCSAKKRLESGFMNAYINSTETSKQCFMNPIECNGFADLPYSMGFLFEVNMSKETKLRPILDFPGYFVNDVGEVWSDKKYHYSEKGTLRKITQKKNVWGYLYVHLWQNKKHNGRLVARLVINAPRNRFVDHADGNRTNNKIENLRLCTNSQNLQNCKSHKNSTSKYKGVSWVEDRKKWVAQICKNYKQRSLGRFNTEIAAAEAYNREAKSLFGEFARLNEI